MSIRRACGALEVDRSTYHYRSRRPGQALLQTRIKEICETRVRYGSRRVHVLLRREGWMINHTKTRRVYNELGMQLRSKPPKRRVRAKLREDRCEAVTSNETWAMDFGHDQFGTGRTLRVLAIVDTFSRFSPAIDPRFSDRADDVAATLDPVCNGIGFPKSIRVDRASGSVSRDLDLWASAYGVVLDVSHPRPSRPTTPSSKRSMAV